MNVDVDPDPEPRPPRVKRLPPRVLVAEDDEQMRRLVADVLLKDGYDVEELADGKELLLRVVEAFLPHHPHSGIDVVVTDLRMPFCSGLDVLKKLRVAHRTTPVLLMTAFGEHGLRERVRDLGGMLLDKPFTPLALRAAVRALFEGLALPAAR
jgi:two-component system, response regulator, stage 0 sporulation protein F